MPIVEPDLAVARVEGAQNQAAGGGLAAAGLAYQAKGLPLWNGEADAVYGTDMADDALEKALGNREEFFQVADFEQVVIVVRRDGRGGHCVSHGISADPVRFARSLSRVDNRPRGIERRRQSPCGSPREVS